MKKYYADEDISIPVKNSAQVKDTAGKIPDAITKEFKPGDELPITDKEFQHYVNAGFKISEKEVDENDSINNDSINNDDENP